MGSLPTLVRLQAVDQEWDRKGRRYQAVRAELGDESALQAERTAEHDREARLERARGELLEVELETGGLRQKAAEANDALYGGRAPSAREAHNLLQGVEQTRARIAHLEDRALALMEEIEDLEREVAAAGKALAAHEQRHARERQGLAEEYRALHGQLQTLRKEREALRATLPAADAALYDQLRLKKAGQALAEVRDGVCQACHVAVPSGKVSVVEEGADVVTCDGCGRILYRR